MPIHFHTASPPRRVQIPLNYATVDDWEILTTAKFRRWSETLDGVSLCQLVQAIDRLAEAGPGLGRPLVGRVEGSQLTNMKELLPGSAEHGEIRALFAYDPWRSAILLIGGDTSGNRSDWHRQAIPAAEDRYVQYLCDRRDEEAWP